MGNRREEIRDLVVNAIREKNIVKEVFNWRVRPLQDDEVFPSISVNIPHERVDYQTSGRDLTARESTLSILIFETFKRSEKNKCDEICSVVETAIANINSSEFDFKYKKMSVETENLSTKILLICELEYSVCYWTADIPEPESDDLNEISMEVH